MKLKDGLLTINKEEMIELMKLNPDNETEESKKINNNCLEMVKKYWGKFTPKQSNWILCKVKFIFRSLKKGTVRDILFESKPVGFVLKRKKDECYLIKK